jgi:hypothetical protein
MTGVLSLLVEVESQVLRISEAPTSRIQALRLEQTDAAPAD